MLVTRGEGKAFVCHDESAVATPESLAAYERLKDELNVLLEAEM